MNNLPRREIIVTDTHIDGVDVDLIVLEALDDIAQKNEKAKIETQKVLYNIFEGYGNV